MVSRDALASKNKGQCFLIYANPGKKSPQGCGLPFATRIPQGISSVSHILGCHGNIQQQLQHFF